MESGKRKKKREKSKGEKNKMKPEIYKLLEDMKIHAPKEPIINSRDRQLYVLVQMAQLLVLIAEEVLEKPKEVNEITTTKGEIYGIGQREAENYDQRID
jgi:hypothetical protein